jgi:hypothetical protein
MAICLGAGAAALAAGGVLFYLGHRADVRPVAGEGVAGVVVSGRF